MIIDFSSWKEYEGASEGSGRSEKIWLVNPANGEIGLFKFNKTEHTTEHFSEKFASELADIIKVDCSNVDLGEYNSRLGSFSYKINKDNEILVEGIQFINRYYPDYDPLTLFDNVKKEYYSLEMILTSLEQYSFQKDVFKMLVFDFLIGNTDRHQNNWAIIQQEKSIRFCPLYDNGSSLCCYIEESKIDEFLGNDKVRFESLVNSKSRSRIRINKKNKKEPTHLEVLEYLNEIHYNDVVDFVKEIVNIINEDTVNLIFAKYTNNIISEKRKVLIKKFLFEKIKLMSRQFNL